MKRFDTLWLLVLTATAILAAAPLAVAQPVPPPVNLVPPGSPLPRIAPPAPSLPGGAAMPQEAPPAGQPVPAIDVRIADVGIVGATAYPPERLAALASGLVGPAVPLARIEAARRAMLDAYRADGYAFTTVSAAVAGGGHLRFTVTEGHVVEVKLEGDIGAAGTQVLRFLQHLTAERPLRNAVLERWLLLAQEIPGVGLHAVLRPSTDEPGALTLVAQVSRAAVSGLVTLDNRASRYTGPLQGLTVLDLNSFTALGERTELSIYRADDNTQLYGQASVEAYVGGSGLKVRLYFGKGDANPSDFLRTAGYQGFTDTFGIGASYPVIRDRRQALDVGAAFDVIDTEVRLFNSQGQEARASRDALRVLRLNGSYAIQDLLLGDDRGAINAAVMRLSHGLGGLGGTGNGNATPGRVGERVDFTKADFSVSRTQTLFSPWPRTTVALKGTLAGQVSGDILPPVEKYYLGGAELNRGYYAGEVTGDSAFVWSAELQLNTNFDTVLFGTPFALATQFYVFYDHGQAWQNLKTEPDVTLSSEGIGVRLFATRWTEFDLEGVLRNARLPSGTPGIVKPLSETALYGRALVRF